MTSTFHIHPESSSKEGSAGYHRDASLVIAGGVNSNVRLMGQQPLCFSQAAGAHLIDVDGNDYIDYALAMGPAILGHAPRAVIDAVAQSLALGQLYAGQSPLELELAKRVRKHIPGADLVRFGMTGTEMVQTALRVARAATGQSRVVKFSGHYHGWLDNILTNTVTFSSDASPELVPASPQTEGQSGSALADTVVLPWNDAEVLRSYLGTFGRQTAAVIMEPVLCNTGVIRPAAGYLEQTRELCSHHGVVLIIDEVVTGFRLGLRGAQGLTGITGDLSIFAKALGGGFPIAALTGSHRLMSQIGSGRVNHSGTYNANVVGISAAIATLDSLSENNGAVYSGLETIGGSLIKGMRDLSQKLGDNLIVQGFPSVFNTSFGDVSVIGTVDEYRRCDEARQKRFLAALLEQGVRPTARGTWFVSTAHTESDVETTLQAVMAALEASR